jgi:hypothetical protein
MGACHSTPQIAKSGGMDIRVPHQYNSSGLTKRLSMNEKTESAAVKLLEAV